jgi:hypothetical protein
MKASLPRTRAIRHAHRDSMEHSPVATNFHHTSFVSGSKEYLFLEITEKTSTAQILFRLVTSKVALRGPKTDREECVMQPKTRVRICHASIWVFHSRLHERDGTIMAWRRHEPEIMCHSCSIAVPRTRDVVGTEVHLHSDRAVFMVELRCEKLCPRWCRMRYQQDSVFKIIEESSDDC